MERYRELCSSITGAESSRPGSHPKQGLHIGCEDTLTHFLKSTVSGLWALSTSTISSRQDCTASKLYSSLNFCKYKTANGLRHRALQHRWTALPSPLPHMGTVRCCQPLCTLTNVGLSLLLTTSVLPTSFHPEGPWCTKSTAMGSDRLGQQQRGLQ